MSASTGGAAVRLLIDPMSDGCSAAADSNSVPRSSTPAKLVRTPSLRFDTGDSALDAALISRRYFSVIVGYHRLRLVKVTG